MAPYTGPGLFPYALTIQNDGSHASPGAQSENIPVTPLIVYNYTATISYAGTWASGATVKLAFFTSGNTLITSQTASQTNMTGGVLYQVFTGPVQAPSNASYAIATVSQAGLPPTALSVYQSEVNDQFNASVNINYTFNWTFWPWTAVGTGCILNWQSSNVLSGDSDSLVLDGIIELLGGAGGVPCDVPELLDSNGVGPTFRIVAPPGTNSQALGFQQTLDLNVPQPTQDVVASMLLDGERPFGTRSSNRTMTLPIIIFGTQAGGMSQVVAAREYLMSLIDQQIWQIKWTPADTGLALVFDCFRALPSTPVYNFNYSMGGTATGSSTGKPNYPIALITLSIQAMPYGRSDLDGVQSLAFNNPLVSGVPTASATVLDNFTSGPSGGSGVFAPFGGGTHTNSLIGFANGSGTVTTPTLNFQGSTAPVSVFPGDACLVVVSVPAATTITISDTSSNTYTQVAQNTGGAEQIYVFAAYNCNQLNSTSTVTIRQTTNQAFTIGILSAPNVVGIDTTNTASGSSNTPSIAVGTQRYYGNFELVIFSDSGANLNTGASGWTAATPSLGVGPFVNTFGRLSSGLAGDTCTSGYAASQNWVALAIAFETNFRWNAVTNSGPGTAGTASVHFQAPRPVNPPHQAAVYEARFTSAVSIVGNPTLSLWFGQSYDTQWPRDPKFVSNVRLAWTLMDTKGRVLVFSHTFKRTPYGSHPTTPKWTQLNTFIPQGKNFSYNAVVGYTVKITNWAGSGHTGFVRMHAWLNSLTANPQSIQWPMSPRGSIYNLFSLPGSARSPVSVQCQLPAQANIVKEYTAGSGTWVTPPGVYNVQAECWAGGGAGAAVNLSRAICGGGGGGGEYAQEPVLNVTPGMKVPWTVGAGGTPGQLGNTVIQFVNPGLSHWTCPANVTTVTVECWGAGAAGAAGGGGGGGGGYATKSQSVTPGVTYYLWCGKGGKADTGTSKADAVARTGQGSWFGNNGTTSGPASLVYALGGASGLTGGVVGGNGGTGSIGTTFHTGGRGGMSPGPGGGGGGGAAGATGNGGTGGDSTLFSFSGSRWQAGGSAGQGNGQGGNGGIGAAAPGFPIAGSAPGGGGGGGYALTVLNTAANPSVNTPGTPQVNYLGADGGNGMVQLTYKVGGGNPVNGGNTVFGSAATTTTVVTAHGGTSASNNTATGAAGGTGSANTIHFNGGQGALFTTGPQASFMGNPAAINIFQSLNTMTYNAPSQTSGVAGSSCSQGVAIALVEAAAAVTDLVVTDSAGNQYLANVGQASGVSSNGAAVYAFVANLEFPVTTSTTLTVSSGTSQQYGVIWYASPYLIGGLDSVNQATNHGNGTALSGQFGVTDVTSIVYQLAVTVNDGNQANTTFGNSGAQGNKTWFAAGSTNTLTAGSMKMSAYVMLTGAGGTGAASSGDVFNATIGSGANWAVICVPLTAANQQATVAKIDWRSGATPGAQTSWGTEAAISANGMIAIVGMAGSGAGVTSAPTAIADASGNSYTINKTVVLPSNGGVMFMATAKVTAALAAGTTGTMNWGTASAAPNYWHAAYWIPNASPSGLDTGTIQGITGTTSPATGTFTPSQSNSLCLAVLGNSATAGLGGSVTATPWNAQDTDSQAYLAGEVWAAQLTDQNAQAISATLNASPWALIMAGFQMDLAGSGGGSAAGPNAAGYPAISQLGGPGYVNGGEGGAGAASVNTPGFGAAVPGGGGGGAYSNVASPAQEGGQGGSGMIRLTWSPPLKTFNTLIVHRPGENADPNLSPIVQIPISDVPNNTEYNVPSVNGLLNGSFNSTYTVILCNSYWDAPAVGTPRQITVTVNQYEFPGGPKSSVQVSRAVTPAVDSVNGLVNLGEVTLPIKDYLQYNDQSYFTVSINDTDTNDRFMDVLFLDTTGQTVLINIDPGQAGYGQYVNYFIDEATPDRDLGFVGASMQDRQHQVSVLEYSLISGGPLYISAGDNLFMTYSPDGAPDLQVTYAPRWYTDRLV